MNARQHSDRLRQSLQQLVEAQPDDQRLRDHLEGLQRDEALPGLTWFWGPRLYARNRVLFRPFILNHFSDWERTGLRWQRVPWSEHAAQLEPWLQAARTHRDTALVRRLLRWKYAGRRWGVDPARWNAALLEAYRTAGQPAARAGVLDEFDDWFELDEDTGLALYATDRASGPFLLKHLPHSFWGAEKRALWKRLAAAAQQAGDEDLYFRLYRKQVPVKQWQAEVVALADAIRDPQRLCDELDRRHPEGYGLAVGDALLKLLENRGRDVLPYIRSKLTEVLGGWYGPRAEPIVTLAERRGWWDLWAAAIRANRHPELFNRAVAEVLDNPNLAEGDRLTRLEALAGVSREWNWPGFGLAVIHGLKDDIAARLYARYPALVHGPYKPNVTPTWWQGYPQLLAAAQQADDEELVDLLASRYATRVRFPYAFGNTKELDQILQTAEALGAYYQALRDRDPLDFARRASNVLTRIPAYAIHSYARLLQTNQLARLLFVRSFDAYLGAPTAVRDLVEGSDIHVQGLAYRVLAQDDDRARQLAVQTLEILIGTLSRPLHRQTRLAAFAALANAARADAGAARTILLRAREALRLPDRRYPKEQLIGLIGHVLHQRPELRGPKEQPVVYGWKEAPA